jgi:hypothetical protein
LVFRPVRLETGLNANEAIAYAFVNENAKGFLQKIALHKKKLPCPYEVGRLSLVFFLAIRYQFQLKCPITG